MGVMRKDPVYLEALKLFDMSGLDESWGMPRDPHARDNLRYAAGCLAADTDEADARSFLELVLKQYVGDKYRNAMRKDIERIAQAARRAHGNPA